MRNRKDLQDTPQTPRAKQNEAIYNAAKARGLSQLLKIPKHRVDVYDPYYWNGMTAAERLASEGEKEALLCLLERGANIHTVAATLAEKGNEALLSELEPEHQETNQHDDFISGMLRGYARNGLLAVFLHEKTKIYCIWSINKNIREKPILQKTLEFLRDAKKTSQSTTLRKKKLLNSIMRGAAEGGHQQLAIQIYHQFPGLNSNSLLFGLLKLGDITLLKSQLRQNNEWWYNHNPSLIKEAIRLGHSDLAFEIIRHNDFAFRNYIDIAIKFGDVYLVQKLRGNPNEIARALLNGGHLSSEEKKLKAFSHIESENQEEVVQEIGEQTENAFRIEKACLKQSTKIQELRKKGVSYRAAYIATQQTKPQCNNGALCLLTMLTFYKHPSNRIGKVCYLLPPELWITVMEYVFNTVLTVREVEGLALSIINLATCNAIETGRKNLNRFRHPVTRARALEFKKTLGNAENYQNFYFKLLAYLNQKETVTLKELQPFFDQLKTPEWDYQEIKRIISQQIEEDKIDSLIHYTKERDKAKALLEKNINTSTDLKSLKKALQAYEKFPKKLQFKSLQYITKNWIKYLRKVEESEIETTWRSTIFHRYPPHYRQAIKTLTFIAKATASQDTSEQERLCQSNLNRHSMV